MNLRLVLVHIGLLLSLVGCSGFRAVDPIIPTIAEGDNLYHITYEDKDCSFDFIMNIANEDLLNIETIASQNVEQMAQESNENLPDDFEGLISIVYIEDQESLDRIIANYEEHEHSESCTH